MWPIRQPFSFPRTCTFKVLLFTSTGYISADDARITSCFNSFCFVLHSDRIKWHDQIWIFGDGTQMCDRYHQTDILSKLIRSTLSNTVTCAYQENEIALKCGSKIIDYNQKRPRDSCSNYICSVECLKRMASSRASKSDSSVNWGKPFCPEAKSLTSAWSFKVHWDAGTSLDKHGFISRFGTHKSWKWQ